ncbi:hypothetical protein NIES4102_31750 [Chondrocystis sp. NIES-4102]|nr:hypothetical protein NIES4102_31750 [Chondrocystis sp. NIES-4102]
MTTIVKHKRTGNQYILLGVVGEGSKVNPSRFLNDLFTQDKPEVSYLATVCDVVGNIFLVYINDLVILEIDGKKPVDLLPENSLRSLDNYPNQQLEDDFTDAPLGEEFENDQYITSSSPAKDLDEGDEDWI